MEKKYRYLGLAEREDIERLWKGGATPAVIAGKIQTSLATIYRELKLGQVVGADGKAAIDEYGRRVYSAAKAQENFQNALKRRGRRKATT